MALSAGTRLGPYEILEKIGSGGMGQVYRANDTRLHRAVAVKVSDAQFTERFEREARTVAALNHPNICTLHDVGPNYLVMELVEGPTLAHRIRQGAIPLEEALHIARQIANALEAAHEKGIVHRDLKPGNINITSDGVVKVLDFGLAKMVEPPASGVHTDNSPTVTLDAATRVGVILGTAAYMPPEQARGKTVDKRADIWAFGVVFYEMLTGQRLFEGETISDTLIEVATKEPDWNRAPVKVQRLLRRCLEKDPKKRLRDIGEVWAWLEDPPQPPSPATELRSPPRPWFAWSAAAFFFVIAALLGFTHFREKRPVAGTMRFQIPMAERTRPITGPFLSPDGRQIAFGAPDRNGQTVVWIRPLDSLDARPLAGTEGLTGLTLFWSPDSRFLGFATRDKLKKIEPSGGPPQTICDLPRAWRGGGWSPTGVIIFGALGGGLMRVSDTGGAPAPLTLLDSSREETYHSSPSFLPDGRHFVYQRFSTVVGNAGVYVGSLDLKAEHQSSKRLIATGSSTFYAPSSQDPNTGHLLFGRQGALMAQAFDNRRMELTGEALTIAEGVNDNGPQQFSVSTTGILATRAGGIVTTTQLAWFDRAGKKVGALGEPGRYNSVALSPDGTRVAFSRGESVGGNVDVWVHEFSRGATTRLTFDPAQDWMATWSPDGGRIVFSSQRGVYNLYQKDSSGAGGEDALLKSNEVKFAYDWSRDARFLLYAVVNPGSYDLWVLPLSGDDRKPRPYLQTQFNETQARFSPDGRWVAYTSDASGKSEVYVQPFPVSTGGKWMVSRGGGNQPRWRRDGKELFYISADSKVMAVDVTGTPEFRAGVPKSLFEAPIWGGRNSANVNVTRYDVTTDGQKFLINSLIEEENSASATAMTVVLNWQAGLKK